MISFSGIKSLIGIEKNVINIILIYSTTISLLSLIVPVSVQSLINVVSFGTVLQPIIVLTIILFIVLAVLAGVRIAQSIVVEIIQQRIFTHISIRLAERLPQLAYSNFERTNISDMVNRFLEIQTIQKSIAVILVTGIEVILLGFFSMVLIAFYHPVLLVFDIILIISFMLAIWLPWKKSVYYAVEECGRKHDLTSWFETIVRNIILFKSQHHSYYALIESNKKICEYLVSRKMHFKNLLSHIIGMNLIYVFSIMTHRCFND